MLENSDQPVDAIVADFGSVAYRDSLDRDRRYDREYRAHPQEPQEADASTKALRGSRITRLSAEVVPTPLGVVGVIGPWNFLLHLVIMPTAAAFAAATG